SYGIRVISLCPGSVNTPLWDNPKVQADFARNLMLTPEDVAQAIVNAAMLPQHVVIDELVLMPNTGTF
ncbi:MAG TPA: short-chain dehydrogenase, partial [Stenomitos sp.]